VNGPDELHLARVEKLIRMKIPVIKVPKNLISENTSFEEQQEMLRKLDNQRKKADPEFKGAFHEKKGVLAARKSDKRKPSRKTNTSPKAATGKPVRAKRKPGK
jgi:ATP-dependent RNA helicase RhlE